MSTLTGVIEDCTIKIKPSLNLRPYTNKDLLSIDDLKQIYRQIQGHSMVFLHELVEGSEIILPQNRVITRNAEVQKRCQTLMDRQENAKYMESREEAVAKQIQEIHQYMYGVLQIILSIVSCFFFGFYVLQMCVDNVDMAARILFGVFCGLITLMAEMYFFVLKINQH